MSPIVVVGAGLAGLACAQRLTAAGLEVIVLEASDAVGGRVRTDEIDGFRCDRGFQLINPAYPALGRVVDLDQLDLRAFGAGVVVAGDTAARSWPTRVDSPGCCPPRCAAPSGPSVSARRSSAGPCPACSRSGGCSPPLISAWPRPWTGPGSRRAADGGARPLPGGGARRLGGDHLGHVRAAADALLPPGLARRAVDGDLPTPRAAGRGAPGRHDPARPAGQRGRRASRPHRRRGDPCGRGGRGHLAPGRRRADRHPGAGDEAPDHVLAHGAAATQRGEAAASRRRPPRPAGQHGGGDQRGSRLRAARSRPDRELDGGGRRVGRRRGCGPPAGRTGLRGRPVRLGARSPAR